MTDTDHIDAEEAPAMRIAAEGTCAIIGEACEAGLHPSVAAFTAMSTAAHALSFTLGPTVTAFGLRQLADTFERMSN